MAEAHDVAWFRQHAHEMVDWIADYYEGVEQRKVCSQVEPGYLPPRLPKHAPEEGETWDRVMEDLEEHVMPGITHWQSPNFFGYFPANVSFPAMLGEMLSATFNTIGFSWTACPAQTELETVVLDWLAKAMGLPECFHASNSNGGGVIQGTASEAVLVALLAARARIKGKRERTQNTCANSKLSDSRIEEDYVEEENFPAHLLVAYTSDQAHSAVQKACMVAGIEQWRKVPTTKENGYAMQAEDLEQAIEEDLKEGRVPFFVCATVGTTSSCAVDPLESLGIILHKYGLYGHVDAAYAGSAMVCPEFRIHYKGIDRWQSLASNCHKWMLTNFDCTAMWTQDSKSILDALSLMPEFLRNKASDSGNVRDYKDWQIPLGRRFRSLKLWFVMRSFGLSGLRTHIRKHVALAELFESYVRADERFEIAAETRFGLVCFRLCADGAEITNHLNKQLLEALNSSGEMFLTHTVLDGLWVLRVAIGATKTEEKHIKKSWQLISETAGKVLEERCSDT
mmetsp:Transcript_2039/g.13171  ORF Transcript_2039/g.13171 Transcript_2039/m.13171 type:complete len:510 (-) Transcript_2039:2125-3654(-)